MRPPLCNIGRVTSRVLALDVGTSSVRASLYGEDGRLIPGSAIRIVHQVSYLADGGVETDADALYERLTNAIDHCLAACPGAVAAVGISCFWHSLMGLDASLHPCTPVLVWADTRSAAQAEALAAELDAELVRARTGCRFHPSYPPAKLRWVRENRRDWWGAAAHWVSFGEYLAQRLGGELVASVSLASGSGLYDQRRAIWDPDVCAAAGVAVGALPTVADLSEADLRVRSGGRWPNLDGARLLLPAGDGACNNVGSGCMGPGRIALMIGSSGAVRRCQVGGPWTVPGSLWQYRLDRRRGLVGGALSNGGNLHQWLQDRLRLDGEIEAALLAREPGVHGLTFLPLLAGERSPGWAPSAWGGVLGLREATTALDLLQAGMEAVAQGFAALVRDIGADGQVIGSGGGVWHSPAWARMLADALGRDIYRSAEAEASSRGAALLALESMGVVGPLEGLDPPLGDAVRADPKRQAAHRRSWERQSRLYEILRSDDVIGFVVERVNPAGE